MFHREERARRQESEVGKTQSWGSAVTAAEKPGLQESRGSGSAGGCLLFPKVGASTSKLQRGARSCFTKPLRFGKAWHTASRGSSTCQPISSLQLTRLLYLTAQGASFAPGESSRVCPKCATLCEGGGISRQVRSERSRCQMLASLSPMPHFQIL